MYTSLSMCVGESRGIVLVREVSSFQRVLSRELYITCEQNSGVSSAHAHYVSGCHSRQRQ